MKLQSNSQPGLQSSQGLTDARERTSQVAHSYGWQMDASGW